MWTGGDGLRTPPTRLGRDTDLGTPPRLDMSRSGPRAPAPEGTGHVRDTSPDLGLAGVDTSGGPIGPVVVLGGRRPRDGPTDPHTVRAEKVAVTPFFRRHCTLKDPVPLYISFRILQVKV